MGIITKYKFNQNVYENFIPEFNSTFTNYTITDEIDTDGFTIRTIVSDNLPTLMRFGQVFTYGETGASNKSLSLLEVLECNANNVTTMNSMFRNCNNLTLFNMSNFGTSKVTEMYGMFNNCFSLTSLDMSNFNTNQVTNMSYMFNNCSSLTSLNVSKFDTSKVTEMYGMFNNCSSLTSLDMSSFNTNKVTTMSYMFNNCSSLTLLDVSNFDTSKVTDMSYMFTNTKNLTDVGALYCNSSTIIKLSKSIVENIKIYYYLSDISELEPHDNIEYIKYIFPTKVQLPPHIQLHSLPDGTRDEVDIKTGVLTRRTQKIDNEIVALESPITEQLILNYNNSCDYGRILPTGICDKYDVVNSMYTQTMTSILLDGENIWDAMEEMTNVVKFTATETTVGVEELNMLGAGGLYCDNDLFPNINDDSDVEHCRVDEAGNKFYIYISKDRLMSPDLIGWQIWLQENKFNLIYELAEHLTYVKPYEELDATQARWEGMDCMRDGAIRYHTNSSDNITMYPTLEYVAPSINNFEVTMLEPNTDYTIYAEGINKNDTINLGGTDINFKNGTVYTSGDNQWLRIDNNDSFYNMVVTKGDTTGEHVPYFEGMASVKMPVLTTSNEDGTKTNILSTSEDVELRGIGDVKDELNVLTGELTQRIGEIMFDGSQRWSVASTDYSDGVIFQYDFNLNYGHKLVSKKIICDSFPTLETMWKEGSGTGIVINSSFTHIQIKSSNCTSSNEFESWLTTNPIIVQYELKTPIIKTVDLKCVNQAGEVIDNLCAFDDGTINLSSDTGLLPTTHYTVPSTNTFSLSSMKTGTRYTLKYPSASGSITIGNITYSISSDSMLFTTPLKINGDASAIIFSDNNPENVVLLEGAYNKREVPFFTGVKSVKNPSITIVDQLSTESITYNCATEIELRGLPNGVADKLDIIKGKLTTNVGIRPYQEGDENLSNVWTDGYETVYALSSPIVTNVVFDHPTVTTNSLIELSSDYLIPQLNYRVLSSNNFPLDLLQPNQTYTLYADTLVNGSYTLGGTRTGVYSQPHTVTLGDMTDNLLTFNGDLGLSNVMLVKGNSLKTTLPSYFLGIRSVIDGHLLVEGMAGEMNEITFDEGIVLRDCNGVKDAIDLITCTLTKRTGEITLTGAEGWSILSNTTINDDLQVFVFTLSGINSSINNGLVCDKFIHRHMSGKLQDTEAIYSTNNQLILVVKKSRIGGDTVNALKSWLNQNPTTVVYPLITLLEIPLENVWITTPPTSYSNQTKISSTVSTNSLKPMISVTVATTTLEEIVSNLEAQNEELENENVATMLALTNIYETFAMPMAINETSTIDLSDGKDGNKVNGMSVSPMGMIYAKLIKKGYKTIEQVPANLQAEVKYALKGIE